MRNFKNVTDKGYVLAFVAILLIPLLAFTSFSVDLGSWYARASSMQQAADAAALGGAVFLPNRAKAENEASKIAQANGFSDGIDGITITYPVVSTDPEGAKKFTVRIELDGDSVPSYFSGVLGQNDTSIIRSSTAEYVPPPRMGSPRNYIGTGNCPLGEWGSASSPFASGDVCEDATGTDRPNLREGWILVEGPQCGPIGEAGTRYSSPVLGSANRYRVNPLDGSDPTTSEERAVTARCSPGLMTAQDQYENEVETRIVPVNPEYAHNGTTFGITVPPGQSVVVEGFNVGAGVFLGGACQSNGLATFSQELDDPVFTDTTYTFIDNGSFDPNAELGEGYLPAAGFDPATGRYVTEAEKPCSLSKQGVAVGGSKDQWNGWYPISPALTAPSGQPKTYWLNVKLGESVLNSDGTPRSDLPSVMTTERSPGWVNSTGYINSYSLRVSSSAGNFVPCTSDPQDPVRNFPGAPPPENCPSIYAIEYLQARFRMASGDSSILDRDFYLSEFTENQVGNTVSVELNDLDFRTQWVAIMSPNPDSRAADSPGDGTVGHPYEIFTPQILCSNGKAASGQTCTYETKNGSGGTITLTETPARAIVSDASDAGIPKGTFYDGNPYCNPTDQLTEYVSYNMCPGQKFYLFRGPTPFSEGADGTPAPSSVWYTSQGNIRGFNAPVNATEDSIPLTDLYFTVGSSPKSIVNAQQTFPDGLSGRTLRLNFPVRPTSDTLAGENDNGYWWKIRFRNPTSGGEEADDRMTWRIVTTGDPVRLIPSNF